MENAHDLMPARLLATIPPLYSQENVTDPLVWAKYFTPDSSWTWYVIEYRPEERLAFGLVVGLETGLGYFNLEELEAVRGPLGLRIERELGFEPTPLSLVRRLEGGGGRQSRFGPTYCFHLAVVHRRLPKPR